MEMFALASTLGSQLIAEIGAMCAVFIPRSLVAFALRPAPTNLATAPRRWPH